MGFDCFSLAYSPGGGGQSHFSVFKEQGSYMLFWLYAHQQLLQSQS